VRAEMLIHNVAERKEAANRKMLALLTFLKEETYSDFKTLKKVVGFKGKSHRPTYALLNKAVALGFLIKHEYPVIAGKKSLWGSPCKGWRWWLNLMIKYSPVILSRGNSNTGRWNTGS
jgi:hypothetical protein